VGDDGDDCISLELLAVLAVLLLCAWVLYLIGQ